MKPRSAVIPPAANPPTSSRRARRQAETRTRLLRAGLDLFARQGYSATTVEQITEAADVGKGTFFNYFPSKDHVLGAFGEMQIAKIEHALAAAVEGGRPARQVWKHLAHELAKEPGRSPGLLRGLLVAVLSRDSVLGHMNRNLARGREFLAGLIARGQQRNELRRSLNPADTARLFQQMFLGALLLWALDPSVKLAPWLDKTFDLFWSGVAADRNHIQKGSAS